MVTTTRPAGSIRADEVYTLAEIKTRLGLGIHALRKARHQGLLIRRVGRRSFVMGRDVLAYIDSAAVVGATRQ